MKIDPNYLRDMTELLVNNIGNKNNLEVAVTRAYLDGYADALKNYSIWKDSEQVIGCLNKPIKPIIAESKNLQIPIRY